MRTSAVFFLFLFPALCIASDNAMVVNAECLNQKAHGAYTVGSGSGQIRISGNYEAGNRSGDFTFFDPQGNKIIVIPYRKGFINGTVTAWHASSGDSEPQTKLLSDIAGGLAVNRYQTWYANGTPRSSFVLDDGDIKSAKVWNADGVELEIKAQSEFLNADIESDFNYYQQLERVLDSFPPQC